MKNIEKPLKTGKSCKQIGDTMDENGVALMSFFVHGPCHSGPKKPGQAEDLFSGLPKSKKNNRFSLDVFTKNILKRPKNTNQFWPPQQSQKIQKNNHWNDLVPSSSSVGSEQFSTSTIHGPKEKRMPSQLVCHSLQDGSNRGDFTQTIAEKIYKNMVLWFN